MRYEEFEEGRLSRLDRKKEFAHQCAPSGHVVEL